MTIEVVNVVRRFGTFNALAGIDLTVGTGEIVALLGPSGSGKTTLLRIVAGLDWPDEGEVRFDGEDALQRSVGERSVGFVFQHYALFRHMTVFENVAFGLRVRSRSQRLPEAEIARRVLELLDLVQIGWLSKRFPTQLSGGQRQRVALARALAIEPRVLLLDEPFGALDAKVRKELRRWLRSLHDEIRVTSIFVTHDQEEALEVADRVVVMDHGRIEQVGTPADVYESPATAFVHDFIGESVVIPVEVTAEAVRFGTQTLPIAAPGVPEGAARLFARPHHVSVVPREHAHLEGTVRHLRPFGGAPRGEIILDDGNTQLVVEIDIQHAGALVEKQTVGIRLNKFKIFPTAPNGAGAAG